MSPHTAGVLTDARARALKPGRVGQDVHAFALEAHTFVARDGRVIEVEHRQLHAVHPKLIEGHAERRARQLDTDPAATTFWRY